MATKRLIQSPKILTKQEIYQLKRKVVERDRYRCVLCGRMCTGVDTHELLFKSADTPGSADIYQERYMATLCPEQHHELHDTDKAKLMLVQILIVLRSRHRYKYPAKLNDLLDRMQASFREEMSAKYAGGG